jgi:glucokinase
VVSAAIGVDIGGTGTKAAIVDRDGNVLLRIERPTDVTAGTKSILAIIDELIPGAPDAGGTVEAIGIGAAGFIDAANGRVTFAPNLVYDDPQVADALRLRVGLPVALDNDANVAAWGERAYGAARGSDHVVYITLGTGIGSGFIVDGKLVRGLSGGAAEFGHTVIDIDGPQCNCGLRGCLEQFASGQAIARMGREAVAKDPASSIVAFAESVDAITAKHVAQAARQYDDTARAVLRQAGRALGIGLSNAVNVFDPDVVVLGGSLVNAGEPYLGPARDTLAAMNAGQKRRPTRLVVTDLKGDAGILGAAALAFDEAR